jgi:hypothetical protein
MIYFMRQIPLPVTHARAIIFITMASNCDASPAQCDEDAIDRLRTINEKHA